MSKCAIRPAHDMIVIKPDEPPKYIGGIALPETYQKTEHQKRGTVLAIGPGRPDNNGKIFPVTVKPGDSVVYNEYSAKGFKVGNEELVFVADRDILGVVDAAEPAKMRRAS